MSASPTDERAAITIRRIRFEYPQGLSAVIVAGKPEESFIDVALSLLLPYLEPYLIRSMRQARPLVKDPRILADLDLFNGQEGQHYRQHIALNEALDIPGKDRVKELEAELSADYQRYTKERSLRWNLAYAEGFEAYTLAMARFSFEIGLFDTMHPAVRDIFAWHLIEEMEHRTVAFDVYNHVCGGYLYRMRVGLFAQWHLNRFLMRTARAMAGVDPVAFKATYGGFYRAWRRQAPLIGKMLTRFLPKLLSTYLPWYSPRRIKVPALALTLGDHYAEVARAGASKASAASAEPVT